MSLLCGRSLNALLRVVPVRLSHIQYAILQLENKRLETPKLVERSPRQE